MYVEFAHGVQSRLNANFGQGAEQPAIRHYVPDQGKLRSATWRELKHRVASCSAQLRNAGVSHGDLTCIIGSSSVELVVCLLACIRLGAIGSIFPPPSPLQDREYYLQQQ